MYASQGHMFACQSTDMLAKFSIHQVCSIYAGNNYETTTLDLPLPFFERIRGGLMPRARCPPLWSAPVPLSPRWSGYNENMPPTSLRFIYTKWVLQTSLGDLMLIYEEVLHNLSLSHTKLAYVFTLVNSARGPTQRGGVSSTSQGWLCNVMQKVKVNFSSYFELKNMLTH